VHRSSTFRNTIPLFAVLAISFGGLAVSTVGSFALPESFAEYIADNPTGPLLLLLRAVLFGLSAWVGGLTLIAVAAKVFGLTRVATAACRLLPGVVRSVVQRSIGMGLVGSMLLSTPAFAREEPQANRPSTTAQNAVEYSGDVANGQRWPARQPTERIANDPDAPTLIAMTERPSEATSVPTSVKQPATTKAPATIPRSLPTAGAISIPQSTIAAANSSSVPPATWKPATSHASAPPVSPTQKNIRTYRVVPGDHFWSIARRIVHEQQPNATETMVATYCHTLIATNRTQLRDPHNPDLLHVGLTLTIPPPT
jgi:LysM domain